MLILELEWLLSFRGVRSRKYSVKRCTSSRRWCASLFLWRRRRFAACRLRVGFGNGRSLTTD